MLIGAPELHHWHHDRDRDAGNFADLSPLMDIAFGTYRFPNHKPERFGLPEPGAQTYVGLLLQPFQPRAVKAMTTSADDPTRALSESAPPPQDIPDVEGTAARAFVG